jgi:hypothetical protein
MRVPGPARRFGQVEALQAGLALARARDVGGATGRRLAEAREALAGLWAHHKTPSSRGRRR